MPNSLSQPAQLTCPDCGQAFQAEIWLIVDADQRPDLLEKGGIHLWRFAAHGNIDPMHPNEFHILLTDGYRPRAEDIHGHRQTHIARDCPLVFLNTCRVGSQSWSLSRLGGWVAAWVDRCRCGAFIGPLWSVNDWLASKFSRRFYPSLQSGQTVGQAIRSTRHHLRNLAPENPTWLAYSFYAHLNARLKLEASKAE